jgi:SIR2-like domain
VKEALDRHCRTVVRQLVRGEVVPLLGAGANLCDRPEGVRWEPGRYLPTGAELAEYLADDLDYPLQDAEDLVRVSEYVDLQCGEGPLYGRLHDVFGVDYPPTTLHGFLAHLPATLERLGLGRRHQLILTTNYDDTLERAFAEADEPLDVVVYRAAGRDQGLFVHRPPDGEPELIRRPNEYRDLSLAQRSILVKVHGAVDRLDDAGDSYVITEDHYIEYLTHTNLSQLVPVTVLAKLLRSSFLFLGYRLRDWNLRVILHRIWSERDLGYRSWAIQRAPDPLDEELWRRRDVDVYDVPLQAYVAELERQLERLAADRAAPRTAPA